MKTLRGLPKSVRQAIVRAARRCGADRRVALRLESRFLFAYENLLADDDERWLARDVGKTAEIVVTACWASVCMPNGVGLITAPMDNMLQPVMHAVQRQCLMSAGLRANFEGSSMSPSWRIRFKNGFTLLGRIAGPEGMNYKGVHADWV